MDLRFLGPSFLLHFLSRIFQPFAHVATDHIDAAYDGPRFDDEGSWLSECFEHSVECRDLKKLVSQFRVVLSRTGGRIAAVERPEIYATF